MKLPDAFHLALLFAAAFLMDLVMRAGGQAYQEGGIAFHGTALQLGLLGTVSAFFYSSMCLVGGRVSDRFGRRASTVLACIGLMVAFALASRARGFGELLGLTVLSGGAAAFFWPAIQAWIADLGGRGGRALTRNLGLFNILWSSGLVAGPVFTGYLWAFGKGAGDSQRVVFLTVAALAGGLGLLMLAVRRAGAACDNGGNGEGDDLPHEHNAVYLRAAWVGVFAGWFAGGVVGSLFPKLGEHLHYDERMRGLLCSSYHLGQLVMFVATSSLMGWRYRRWPLVVSELAGGAALVGVLWADSPLSFSVIFLLAGMAAGAPYVASLFYSLHGRTKGQGRTAGLHEAILASGVVIGPLIGGYLGEHVSLRAPFVAAGLVLALATVVQWRIWGKAYTAAGEKVEARP